MRYLIFTFVLASLFGCRTEEELNPINDFYSLHSIACECDPIEIIPFQQQWNLNFDNFEVDVRVFNEVEQGLIFEQGKYSFQIIDTINSWQNPSQMIKINNRPFWFSISEEFLHISDPGAECDKGSSYSFAHN